MSHDLCNPRKIAAHQGCKPGAQPGAGVTVGPCADYQIGLGLQLFEQSGDFLNWVLSIGIDADHGCVAVLQGMVEGNMGAQPETEVRRKPKEHQPVGKAVDIDGFHRAVVDDQHAVGIG